jgi:hypothetical protein
VVLASGHLFTALMAVPHALSFPGLLSPTGLSGGSQTTAWLYMFWHSGFLLTVMAHALLSNRERDAPAPTDSARSAVIASAVAVLVAVGVLTLLAAYADESLPAIITSNGTRLRPPSWSRRHSSE